MMTNWQAREWTSADGSIVPYRVAKVSGVFTEVDAIEWELHGVGAVWIEARQWPRNTTIVLCQAVADAGMKEYVQRYKIADYPNATVWKDVQRDRARLECQMLSMLKVAT